MMMLFRSMQGSIHEPPRAQTESSRPLTGRADSSQHKGQEAAAPAGQPARQAAARKRLPPLPLSARGPPQGSKPTAATRHAAQQASSTARQQPHKSIQSEQMAASHRCTAADTKVQADQAAVPGTSGCQQELQKLNAASESEQGFAGGASPPVDAIQTQQQTQQQAEQQAQRQAQRQPKQQPQQQPQRKAAPSKGRQASSASVSLPECSALSTVTSSNTAESGKASARSAAKPVGAAGHQQAGAGERAGQGQQQVARLAASNTALLSELVELQVCSQPALFCIVTDL